ncbi:hypothetical protein [Hydrogenophaga sp.]|uniref:hypothetical protein n=1 Tax=Hydrogenophaga sp. TaxID=1904254 RepID=UPI00272D1FBE|nr:hypothetical protein [Hydrogenophaga sp.]
MALKKPWKDLDIVFTEEHRVHFGGGAVSTQWLRLSGATTAIDDAFACPALETIEIDVAISVNILYLTRLLVQFPKISSVKTPFSFLNKSDVEATLTLLRDRPPVNLEIISAQRDPELSRRIQEATQRRLLQDLDLASEGAGKGWAYGIGQLMVGPEGAAAFIDVGAGVGRLLDPQSARALAQTSRSAYVGWRQAWTVEVERIKSWMSPEVGYEAFRQKLLDRMNGESPFNNLAGPMIDTYPEHPTLSKAITLHEAGMPTDVIAMAIGLQLNDHAPHTQELLEALAYLGVITPEAWLKDAYAIDVPAPSVLPG